MLLVVVKTNLALLTDNTGVFEEYNSAFSSNNKKNYQIITKYTTTQHIHAGSFDPEYANPYFHAGALSRR